jgi:CMP-N-acetylneuraminic acid synthetase
MKDHSERVKGKNFRDFCGKPLYEHILQTLDRTYAVDEILINTDSPRIMMEAPKVSSKVRILERPEGIRGDFVSMNKIIAHDLQHTEAQIILQTHSTNPLLKAETLAQALRAFTDDEQCDSLFGVNEYHSRFYFTDGRPVNHDPEDLIRTQDLPPLYEENSSLYVFTHESFAKHQRRIGEKPRFFPVPRIEAIDIDDEFTFRLAELLSLYATSSAS